MRYLYLTFSLMLFSCFSQASPVSAVKNFDLQRYLGKWYEVARLDHSFERHLMNASAYYEMRPDGGMKVTNTGFHTKKKKWKKANGKAYFVNEPDEGRLKVSFFWPFYGAYIIFELDHEDYQYAFIAGPSEKYLWLLSRTPTISDQLKEKFITQSNALGFNTDELIWVTHDDIDNTE